MSGLLDEPFVVIATIAKDKLNLEEYVAATKKNNNTICTCLTPSPAKI